MNASTTITIENSLKKVREYIERSDYKGFDPYDGLMSPVFSIPLLSTNHRLRFLAQQFIKRSPVNLRPILGIRKGVNPVTVGLSLQAYTALAVAGDETARKKCSTMVAMLESMAASGFSGPCWGYDFHWEARYARIPAFQPTVVATGIITNALYKYVCLSGDSKARDMVVQSAAFVINDLNRTTDQNGAICFSYSPFDRQVVFNASLKGARLLVHADALSTNSGYSEIAKQAARFVSDRQTPEGSWSYADKKGNWTDNYHTGYVLDCLEEIGRLTGTDEFVPGIRKGINYYLNTFFEDGRIPRFYDKSTWPVDCTAAAQSILTLVRFGETATAIRVAEYMAGEMQAADGHFYFRKYRNHTVRTPFMRWSDAWMFAALAELEGQIRKV